jgi:hypothetical protein
MFPEFSLETSWNAVTDQKETVPKTMHILICATIRNGEDSFYVTTVMSSTTF